MKRTPTIYLKIYVDYALTKKLLPEYNNNATKFMGTFRNKIRNIVDDAELMFTHPSLDENVTLVLQDTIFLWEQNFLSSENASRYFGRFREWKNKIYEERWYFSVLMTGLDIYDVKTGGGVDKLSTGRSYMKSMCNPSRSCTLLQWHHTNVPYLLAHEIAHSMGVNHDGPPNNHCSHKGYVMSPRYNSGTHPKVWSPCSREELKQYLRSKKAECLFH